MAAQQKVALAFIALVCGAVFMLSAVTSRAAENEESIDMRPLRAAANNAGNLGTALWAYDFQNATEDEVQSRANALIGEINTFEAQERQKSLDQFGDFVDPLPGMKAALLKKALGVLAAKGKLDGLLSDGDAKNIVVQFDVETLARAVREGPVLASTYGHFMGKTADGNGFGVLAPPGIKAIYLMKGNTIVKEASAQNNIAVFTFDELDRVIAGGGGAVAMLYEFNPEAQTYVLPGSVATAEGFGDAKDIEGVATALKSRSGGIAGMITLLAHNGRTCVALGAPVLARSGVKNFLAQTSQIFGVWFGAVVRVFEDMFGAIWRIFSPRASAAGEVFASRFCAGTDESGNIAAPIVKISGGEFSDKSVVRINGVDQETVLEKGMLIATAPKEIGVAGAAVAISIVAYPEFKLVVGGAGFNPGAIIRVNGEDVPTIERADKTLSAAVPVKFRGKNPVLLTVYNPISQKESSPAVETWVPPKDKPLAPGLKAFVIASARAIGQPIDAIEPQDLGRNYQYYYDLWKSVIAQMK